MIVYCNGLEWHFGRIYFLQLKNAISRGMDSFPAEGGKDKDRFIHRVDISIAHQLRFFLHPKKSEANKYSPNFFFDLRCRKTYKI
jgi:hypothetical protein